MFTSSLPYKNVLHAGLSLRKLLWLLLIMLSLFTGFQISVRMLSEDSMNGLQKLSSQVSLPAFELQDQYGQPFGLANLKGQWSILFFGFTQCPDICPATLQQMTVLNHAISQQTIAGVIPQTVFISVDPARDSKNLAEYVAYFSDQFFGVSGDMSEVGKLEKTIGAWHQYQKRPTGDYNVAHSGELFVINPKGELQARLQPPMDINMIAQQLLMLMSGQG